jgi:hypothetical protein
MTASPPVTRANRKWMHHERRIVQLIFLKGWRAEPLKAAAVVLCKQHASSAHRGLLGSVQRRWAAQANTTGYAARANRNLENRARLNCGAVPSLDPSHLLAGDIGAVPNSGPVSASRYPRPACSCLRGALARLLLFVHVAGHRFLKVARGRCSLGRCVATN